MYLIHKYINMKYTIILLFICSSGISQTLKNLKFRDTIFILINFNADNPEKFSIHSNKISEQYMYRANDTTHLQFLTNSKKFTTPLNYKMKLKDTKNLHNKYQLKDFIKYGIEKTIYDLKIKKVKCFIIDKKDCLNREVMVKTAFLSNQIKIIE